MIIHSCHAAWQFLHITHSVCDFPVIIHFVSIVRKCPEAVAVEAAVVPERCDVGCMTADSEETASTPSSAGWIPTLFKTNIFINLRYYKNRHCADYKLVTAEWTTNNYKASIGDVSPCRANVETCNNSARSISVLQGIHGVHSNTMSRHFSAPRLSH